MVRRNGNAGMSIEDRDLITKAQEGNNWAFEQLVQKYDRRILALARELLGNSQDAEDVYQEVFMRVYHKINGFRFESDFYTWLYRIAVNCAITFRKKRNRERHRSIEASADGDNGFRWIPADEEANPQKRVHNQEIKEQIETQLDGLPLMQRTVFVLRFFQDFKIKDIAEIIGCAEGTVKNYLFRGTQKMRKNLSAYYYQR